MKSEALRVNFFCIRTPNQAGQTFHSCVLCVVCLSHNTERVGRYHTITTNSRDAQLNGVMVQS